jgi:methylated-DNA-[protein]-cysteine S-methyltransferase
MATITATTRVHVDIDSPVGPLRLVEAGGALAAVRFLDRPDEPPRGSVLDRGACTEARRQLQEYFEGRRREFDLVLAPEGTTFQRRVWDELCRIPFGTTISYRALAERIGQPAATRAVGLANGRNPIAIVVPCHRVIGANGSLTGYGGGLERKRYLLALEREQRLFY